VRTLAGSAVSAKLKHKEWDAATERWVLYDLQEEAQLVGHMNEVRFKSIYLYSISFVIMRDVVVVVFEGYK
jgi:hypothetical protein